MAEPLANSVLTKRSINHPGDRRSPGRDGYLFGIASYASWGLLPIYWKLFKGINPFEVLVHRIIWSFVFALLLIGATRTRKRLMRSVHSVNDILLYITAAALIALNWGIYIWAVANNLVIESSLGYFINPLLNVGLGCLLFRERLSRQSGIAVMLAAAAVVYLGVTHGSVPWVALGLAGSLAGYAVVKKRLRVSAIDGMLFETAVLVLPAIALAVVWELDGTAVFLHGSALNTFLLISTGILTATPLIAFAAAAKRLPLSTLGMLQYISPTCQFIIAVTLFGEPISQSKLCAFALIWLALAIFIHEQFKRSTGAGQRS